jgi:hypothetical protein
MKLKLADQDLSVMYSRGLNLPELCAYKYIFNRGVNKYLVIFPEELRKWLQRNSHDGSTISTRHAWRIINNLCERGFGEIRRSGFGRIELVLYSLDFVCGRKSKAETDTPDVDSKEKTENKEGVSDAENKSQKTGIDQQQLIYVDQKCRSVGVVFQKEDLWKIAKYPKELINLAINCFKSAEMAESTFIKNPAGWLIRCLEKKYYRSYRAEKFVSSAEQKLFELQDWFLENFGSIPRRADFSRGMPIPSQ